MRLRVRGGLDDELLGGGLARRVVVHDERAARALGRAAQRLGDAVVPEGGVVKIARFARARERAAGALLRT